MSRFFTHAQAERLLPEVEAAIRDAIYLKHEHQQAEAALREAMQRITMSGGARVDSGKLAAVRQRQDQSAAGLQQAIETVHGFGCLVKDLDIGLIDFPTLFRGREVYLCWKLGETGIEFWHGIEEGFRGRKPIDRDFLDHHQGDSNN
ncbi:MAG: DUF2203 domain-containing protein [Bryobacteraceae bacterium]